MERFGVEWLSRNQVRAKSNHSIQMRKQIPSGYVVERLLLNNKNEEIASRFKSHLNVASLKLYNSVWMQ